jgi:2-dehydropantoate 2-reductase
MGRQSTTEVGLTEQLTADDCYDLVLVVVRKNQLPDVLPCLAVNRPSPAFLFMVNNASGPEPLIQAVGRERVLLGFAGAGGTREGHVVTTIMLSGESQPTTIGELDGRTTPRLEAVTEALRGAGFPTAIEAHMDAWLKTHVALVSPIANAIYLAGGSNYRLANTPDGLLLLRRAICEGFEVLRSLGIPITPARLQNLVDTPEPEMVESLRQMMGTSRAEMTMAKHACTARDEARQLTDDFLALCAMTSIPTPAIHRLSTYIDPATSPMAEGSAKIPLWETTLPAKAGSF